MCLFYRKIAIDVIEIFLILLQSYCVSIIHSVIVAMQQLSHRLYQNNTNFNVDLNFMENGYFQFNFLASFLTLLKT